MFQPGAKTDTPIRFPHWPASAARPTPGRTRGFSLRFYTSEGNLDIVGNNARSSSFMRR